MSHAAQRASERYGIELSDRDLNGLAARCLAGEGLFRQKADGSRFHTLVFGDRVLWIVYMPPGHANNTALPGGTIVTIVPNRVGAMQAGWDRDQILKRTRGKRKRRNK